MPHALNQQTVLQSCTALPPFPPVVLQILAMVNDPDASLALLARHVETDAVIAGHVLALCNRASHADAQRKPVVDVFTALSLVGLARVRDEVLALRLASFVEDFAAHQQPQAFWAHSLGCAVCGVELAHYTTADVGVDTALISCLLHDIGQLWLQRFAPEGLAQARQAERQGQPIHLAERAVFGVDHGVIGAWLAAHWGLSDEVCQAILQHHAPDAGVPQALVALVHVAEVLSNALQLNADGHGRVTTLSEPSCALLGLDWGPDSQGLFGRIEARSRHAFGSYRTPA